MLRVPFTAFLVVMTLVAVIATVPEADAQVSNNICSDPNIGCCGDLTLILLNPDLAPGRDGFIHASGQLFAQFQAIGEQAGAIETFGFSFGAHVTQFPDSVCDLPPQAWFTGQQVMNYRADVNPDDGFFINLQTPLVPDGTYTAAIHAFDGSDVELARFWAQAVVENCDTAVVGTVERCDGDAEQLVRTDTTLPWPIILPGDGQKPEGITGFSLEFAELLDSLKVTLNGADITSALQAYDGRLWDDDLLPGYGPYGLGNILVPECSQQPPQACERLGIAYQWNERELTADDVLRVEAADLSGNIATKDIHVGSSVTSGAITDLVPILSWAADTVKVDVAGGQSAVFGFTITNNGGATGHPFASVVQPDGWGAEWQPTHMPVPSGESRDQELVITPPRGIEPGSYKVNASMEYTAAGGQKFLRQALTVVVTDSGGPFTQVGTQTQTNTGAPTDEESPGFSVAAAFVLLAFAIVVQRRRR